MSDNARRLLRLTLSFLVAALLPCVLDTLAQGHPLDTLPPGTWMEVPNSKLQSVAFPWPAGVHQGSTGVQSIMSAWSGGAYDTKRDRLLVFGGGHSNYSGNELFAFSVPDLKWTRLTDPSLRVDREALIETSGYYPDAQGLPDERQPRSRHTYGALQYVPSIDKLCAFGANAFYPRGSGGKNTDCFDADTKQWQRQADAFTPAQISAYDPLTGHIWTHGGAHQAFLAHWNPLTNVWTKRSTTYGHWEYRNMTADIDLKRRKLVGAGGGKVYSWDLTKPGLIPVVPLTTTGATDILNTASNAPGGFVYDPVSDTFVAWHGGANVYTLHPDTLLWQRRTPAPTNTVTPTGVAANGTFGRFRYMPRYNAFIVVNSVNQNVYLYRFGWAGPAATPTDRTHNLITHVTP